MAFAFRLFDLDGSGALEPHEALIVLRDALRSEIVGGVAEELSKTQEKHLRKVLEDVAKQTGRDTLGPTEFAMVCTRAPRVYQSAKLLYEKLCRLSKEPCKVVMALSPDARQQMLKQAGRVSLNFSGQQQQQLPHFGADALAKSVYKPTPKRIMEAPPPRPALVAPGYGTLLAYRESESRRSDAPRVSRSENLLVRRDSEMQRGDAPRVSSSLRGAEWAAPNVPLSGMNSRPQSPAMPPAAAGPGGPRQSQAAGAPRQSQAAGAPRQCQASGAPLAPHLANAGGGARPQSAGRPPSAAGNSRRLSTRQ